jgi:hypothetical protein
LRKREFGWWLSGVVLSLQLGSMEDQGSPLKILGFSVSKHSTFHQNGVNFRKIQFKKFKISTNSDKN